MKTCNKCKIEKPATPDYFNRNKKLKDGLFNICKKCQKEYDRKHYQKNKEKHNERSKKYYQENKEEITEYRKKHRQENKEYYSEYYQKNREKMLEHNRNYYKENREYFAEYDRKYRLENPEVSRLKTQRRKARMYELPHTLTVEEWEETLEYFDNGCAYCGDSESGLAQDHVIPIFKGGGYEKGNIIPACKSCNSSKNARNIEEWYKSRDYYDEEKMSKVTYWITLEMKKG